MKKRITGKKLAAYLLMNMLICFSLSGAGADFSIVNGNWKIQYSEGTRTMDVIYNNATILAGVHAKAKIKSGNNLLSTDYPNAAASSEQISDDFGAGEKHTVRYLGGAGTPELVQVFYFYADKPYFLTETYIESTQEMASNYIAPVVTATRSDFFSQDENNRVLSVPFDNDGWVRYSAFPFRTDSVSFEVTSFFNVNTRKGLIIGSVEHDTWKTGIRYSTSGNQYIEKLECFGGITHALTRDINTGSPNTSKEHGYISGKSLKSPKIMIGVFDDWRNGMDEYGRANAVIAPPRTWDKGTPFGWNSWGAMNTKVNYAGVVDVANFIKQELSPESFENNGVTYIGLDSYWNENFSNSELRNFVRRCNENGQEAGIYWGPFSDWNGNGERSIVGTEYKYKDAYLYANGTARSIAAKALDPTHPGTKKLMETQIEQFKNWGFKYIKLDFINNGILEADSFYEEGVTTGVQAYNHGMQYLVDLCGDDIFLALSIAPSFPSQYGHSKRISCDAWGAMTSGYGSTEYMLNSLSFGWWLDKVYTYNDADHLVLYDEAENRKYSESENRARITSGVITGIYMLGDNYSRSGTYIGTQTARDRAALYATNKDINDIARLGKSFYPVEGNRGTSSSSAEDFFMMHTDEYVYFAAFNFSPINTSSGEIDLTRLGTSVDEIESAKELWSGQEVSLNNGNLPYSVPYRDVKVYRLKKNGSSIKHTGDTNRLIRSYLSDNILKIQSEEGLSNVTLFSLNGTPVYSAAVNNEFSHEVDVSLFPKGVFILIAKSASGTVLREKFIR